MTPMRSIEPSQATEASSVLSTLNEDGSRRWLRPRPSAGRFLTSRRFVAYALILIFTAIPYIQVGGKPLVLLDLARRHFTIFGVTFLPTDTLLLAVFMVMIFVAIFLLTALFGRVWCGWACPQTVYMEFVFRPLERLFDGTPGRAKKGWLARSGTGSGLKYPVYLLVSLYLAHTFLAYFVGVETLATWVTQSPLRHPGPFLVVLAVTGLMMFDFSYFREQICLVACPYGRFQSVLLDRQSKIVGYDVARGEPRGKPRRDNPLSLPVIAASGARRSGDCVDCHLCVTTCPTGIDIRNGLQMECVNCAQCIDACDAVMTKLKRPRGLIRYASQAELAGEPRRRLRPRVVVYPAILVVLVTVFISLLATRQPADVTILRGLGRPFTQIDDRFIGNQIRVKIVNRTDKAATFSVATSGVTGARAVAETDLISLAPGAVSTTPFMVAVPVDAFVRGKCPIWIVVRGDGGFVKSVRYELMGPGSLHRSGDENEPAGHPEGDSR